MIHKLQSFFFKLKELKRGFKLLSSTTYINHELHKLKLIEEGQNLVFTTKEKYPVFAMEGEHPVFVKEGEHVLYAHMFSKTALELLQSQQYANYQSDKLASIEFNTLLAAKYGCSIHPDAIIRGAHETNLKLGKGSHISELTYISVADESGAPSFLSIGEKTYIGQFNNMRCAGQKITIGSHCLISQGVSIIGSNHSVDKADLIQAQQSEIASGGVIIEDDVWIGCNAIILPGVCIAKGSVIAAGAVVTNDTSPYGIYAGIPARKINERN